MSKIESIIKFTYDSEVDAAYIRLTEKVQDQSIVRTVGLDEESGEAGADINLDFDKSNRLIGIEILHASAVLGEDLFEALKAMR